MGKHKKPFYRMIVTDAKSRRDGPFIEILGTYDPKTEPSTLKIDVERAKHWIANGAQPSDTCQKLLKQAGI
jgi:small subunit ribosomal protein S16